MFVLNLRFIFLSSIILATSGGFVISNESEITFASQVQKVKDQNLKVETVYDGLEYPTSMTFVGPGDILVTEKDKGTVQRIIDGQKSLQPVFDAAVANENERGLLGIIHMKNSNGPLQVYLYFTESNNNKDGNDYCPEIISCEDGNDPLGARIYRYDLEGGILKNPELILDLPATPGSDHVGGGLLRGPDNNIYLTVGDGNVSTSLASNIKNGTPPDGRGGILKIPQDYNILKNSSGIFGNEYPLNLYYAYGIRNGFGLDFDPVTGKLWDTENGRDFGDEINLVDPGFNSGWKKIQGNWIVNATLGEGSPSPVNPKELVNLDHNGKYSAPEFTWEVPIGVTAIKFFDSDKFGKKYDNDLFVADIHKGNVYHFDLNEKRTGLILEGKLADKVDNYNEDSKHIFASGFHGITDIEVGPDGYLYLLSFNNSTRGDRHHYYGTGGIYRIVPSDNVKP